MRKPKGIALIFALILTAIFVIITGALLTFLEREYFSTTRYYKLQRALALAEAGIDKAVWELNKPGSTYTGEVDTLLGGGKFSVDVEEAGLNSKIITASGQYPATGTFIASKTIRVTLRTAESEDAAFYYATQIGDWGLEMYSNSEVFGNAYSNGNITGYSNSKIHGDAYAVGTISEPAPLVDGEKHPGSPSAEMPSINIDLWKAQANINEDPIEGDYELGVGDVGTLGPRKINGNFTMNSNAELTLTGPLWVTGNWEMNNQTHLWLDEGFGSDGTVVVVDGTIRMNGGAEVHPTSADPKGYVLFATTDTGPLSVEFNSTAKGGVYYALGGTIQMNANANVVAVVGRKLILNSNAELHYDIGLADTSFTSGPGGIWAVKKGTWTEVR